jgi:predicted amidophosphoribosyltransferase
MGALDGRQGIAGETLTRDERAENIRGAFELAHLNQVAARSVLSTGTTASEGARVFGQAGAKPVWVRTVARKLRTHAFDFEAEPEEEFLVQAQ